jgi:hypothetical protein
MMMEQILRSWRMGMDMDMEWIHKIYSRCSLLEEVEWVDIHIAMVEVEEVHLTHIHSNEENIKINSSKQKSYSIE